MLLYNIGNIISVTVIMLKYDYVMSIHKSIHGNVFLL